MRHVALVQRTCAPEISDAEDRRATLPQGWVMSEPAVIVVGAGPAGMLLALLLARSGVGVVVVEQATTFAREFRGELLAPGAIRIFEDLGLRERILALGGEFPSGVDIQNGKKRLRFDFQTSSAVSRPGDIAIVPQRQLLEVLAEEVSRHANSKILMGYSVRELLNDARGVAGVKAVKRGGEPLELRAALVVACDGRFSTIRRAAGITLIEKLVAFDLLWFSTPIPSGFSNRAYVRITHDELFASFASRSNRMQVGWLIRKGEYARLRTRPFADVVHHIATHVPMELRDTVRAAVTDWADVSLLPVVSQLAERWSQPGLLLIGDAAHPMSPAGGQGINVAIYDAAVAARRLVPALETGLPLDAVARSIENERRPAVFETQRAQNMLAGFLFALGPRRALGLAIPLVRAGARISFRPRFITKLLDRFLWGDPQVRADYGPWQSKARLP